MFEIQSEAWLRPGALLLAERSHSMYRVLAMQSWADHLPNPVYDTRNVVQGMAGTDIVCPDIDKLLLTYVSYFISCKFLPPPAVIDQASVFRGLDSGKTSPRLSRTNRSMV